LFLDDAHLAVHPDAHDDGDDDCQYGYSRLDVELGVFGIVRVDDKCAEIDEYELLRERKQSRECKDPEVDVTVGKDGGGEVLRDC